MSPSEEAVLAQHYQDLMDTRRKKKKGPPVNIPPINTNLAMNIQEENGEDIGKITPSNVKIIVSGGQSDGHGGGV